MKDKKGLVLCVDDEPNILRSLHWLLHKDFDVMTAPSGLEGLEMLRKHDFDVIISDQRMPGMTGSEFLREACKLSPRAMRILLTGYSDMQAILRSINEGEVFRFVNKPWQNEDLTKTVAEAAAIAKTNPAPGASSLPDLAKSRQILRIDGKHDMLDMVKDVVEPNTVLRHSNYLAQAVKTLSNDPVDVIVCETRVGGRDATPLIKLLKQQRPDIVSIVLTVDSDVDAIIKLINQGQIYRFVPKPVKPGFMKLMLNSALHKHHELKANPSVVQRHKVERLDESEEAKLMQDLQQQAQAMPAVAMAGDGSTAGGSLFGWLSGGFKRMFG